VTIARIGPGVDTMFLNFLNPALVPPSCVGTCEGGLGGGHMDVDYDIQLFGGTSGHEHEYDDSSNRTYVDYFDMNYPGGKGKLGNVDTFVDNNDEFIITIANADMSPGAVLTIGNWQINVVDYQRLLHKALAAWDGTGNLLDENNRQLNFKLPQLQAAGGTFRTSFDSLAIVNGGLHPTQTNCVKGDKDTTYTNHNGRWRNGALVVQLIDFSHFQEATAYDSPLDRLVVQDPDDMHETVVMGGKIIHLTQDLSDPLDGDTLDEYEVIGGMHARDDAEFLYESTLFWHFGGKESVLGTKPCYGEAGWDAAVWAERGLVTEAFFDDLVKAAGFTTVDADGDVVANFPALVTAYIALEAAGCGDTSSASGGCKETYEALLELVDLSQKVVDEDGNHVYGTFDTGTGTGLEGAGTTPVVIEGTVANTGVTSGPNFTTGRRTWIDILPAE